MGKKPSNTDIQFWRDSDLPGVEVRYSNYHEEAFRDHTHEAYSIGFLESGRTTFLLKGEPHDAEAGQMVLIEPEAVHACNPDLDSNMAYHMFYVDPDWVQSVSNEVFGDESGTPRFLSPVVDDAELLALWRSLLEVIVEGGGKLEKESLLVEGLADLLTRHAEMGEVDTPAANESVIMRVTVHLSARIAEKVSLDELAEVAGLSRYHLLRVFQAATGLSPHAYQTQLRVDLGKRLLASGREISQAAAEAGFSDQSHFSRVFKKVTGATPQQYKDANRE